MQKNQNGNRDDRHQVAADEDLLLEGAQLARSVEDDKGDDCRRILRIKLICYGLDGHYRI
jgi:hypothetical protein